MTRSKTIVRGVRLSPILWFRLTEVAKREGKCRNRIIVELIENYCDKKSKVIIDKTE